MKASRAALGLAAAMASVATVAGSARAFVAPGTSFTDRAGDASRSADIRTVDVSAGPGGAIAFRIATNRQVLTPKDEIYVFVDADRNGATGGFNDGIDYALVYMEGRAGILSWTPVGYQDISPARIKLSVEGGMATFSVPRSVIGGASDFNFFVSTTAGTVNGSDSAPDRGVWRFQLPSATGDDARLPDVALVAADSRLAVSLRPGSD